VAKEKDVNSAIKVLTELGTELAFSALERLAKEAETERARLEAARSLVDIKTEAVIFTLTRLAGEAGE